MLSYREEWQGNVKIEYHALKQLSIKIVTPKIQVPRSYACYKIQSNQIKKTSQIVHYQTDLFDYD